MLLKCRPRHGMTLAVLCTSIGRSSRPMKLQKKLSLYYTTVLYDMVDFMFKEYCHARKHLTMGGSESKSVKYLVVIVV